MNPNPTKEALLLIACLLTLTTGFPQGKEINSEFYANFSPKDPSVGSLGSFGNTKINYYRGLPEISLEMMTLQGKDLSVPISLNYDASGIRTDELSGMTGIKWNLNAGGFIERQVNNLPDEAENVGYWKHAKETDYFKKAVHTDWVQWNERNDYDCGPDEFVIIINGRSIRFVFDKNRQAQTVPRQNVQVKFFLTEKGYGYKTRIDRFEVTLEDGVKYLFGGSFHTVSEKKIETLTLSSVNNFQWLNTCPTQSVIDPTAPAANQSYNCNYDFKLSYKNVASTRVKTIDYFNNRWYLSKIIHPTGETMDFSYANLGPSVYNLKPTMTRIFPAWTGVDLFTHTYKVCDARIFGICIDERTVKDNYYKLPVAAKWGRMADDPPLTGPPTTSTPTGYFTPTDYPPSPGSTNFYHTLISEQTSRLLSITSSKGNRINFDASQRADLPNTMQYDAIELHNMNGQLIKRLKLNYTVIAASESKDLFWFGEGLIMKEYSYLNMPGPYYANFIKKTSESDIPNKTLVKFVYEGLKDYNYKRTFLTSIEDVTDSKFFKSLYEFAYNEPWKLRRRTTTYHDIYGFATNICHESDFEYHAGKTVKLGHGSLTSESIPTAGTLQRIKYPTNGYTLFTYTVSKGIKLQLIQDFDELGNVQRQREIEYPQPVVNMRAMATTQLELHLSAVDGYARYAVQSSVPQNDSYTLTHGVIEGNERVIVYHGTKTDNVGFERLVFSSANDPTYRDIQSTVISIPSEPAGDPNKNIFPYPKSTERDYLRGLLLRHDVFKKGSKETDDPVSSVTYTYKVNPYSFTPVPIIGYKGGSFNWKTGSSTWLWFGSEADAEKKYRYSYYSIIPEWVVLERKTEVISDETDLTKKVAVVEEYVYDPVFLQQTERTRYALNDPGNKTTTRTKFVTHSDYNEKINCDADLANCRMYCTHMNGGETCQQRCDETYAACLQNAGHEDVGAIQRLRMNNQINTPIEIQDWATAKGVTRLVTCRVYKYVRVGDHAVAPKEIWGLNQGLLPTELKTSHTTSGSDFVKDSRMRLLHSFNSYDEVTGNLLSQSSSDGLTVKYSWGHNGSLVTAQTITGSPEQRKSFVHLPMIGVRSVTDENGIKTTYSYDRYGRLESASPSNAEPSTYYFYHNHADTYKETVTASLKVTGPQIIGQTLRIETPPESRQVGKFTYRWDPGNMLSYETETNYFDFAYTQPGTYNVVLTKKHSEFGTAVASIVLKIVAARKVNICIDGAYFNDSASSTATLFGTCTTQQRTTKLLASYDGLCGSATGVAYRWEEQSTDGSWVFLGIGSTVSAPLPFLQKVRGQYHIRCIVTDSCGYKTTSSIITLTNI